MFITGLHAQAERAKKQKEKRKLHPGEAQTREREKGGFY